MTTQQFTLFICGLILPTLYQRTKFALNRSSFNQISLRERSGLNIHHGHWGFILAFVSMGLLVSGVHNDFSVGLTGFGWGLMLDEIIPMLMMPSPGRHIELDVYEKSRNTTIVLMVVIAILSLIIFLILHSY